MTKANANAAANAQEQQAAQQQILRDLLALGREETARALTLKEISDALSHLELSSGGHRQGVRDARDHGHRG